MVINIIPNPDFKAVKAWIKENEIEMLNVAGQRESQKEAYEMALTFMKEVLI
jgi:hypothetical protein